MITKFKIFENLKYQYELIGYPEGNIITVTQDEFDALREEDFDIRWDDEPDYKEQNYGQWRFMNEEEEAIIEWLEIYRNTGNKELPGSIKKYNL